MDPDYLRAKEARDQFWSRLVDLLPEIDQLAEGPIETSPRKQQLIQVLAKVVIAELRFRDKYTEPE
jgi:hypothetical protein